jgi:hypothetical protein
MNLINHGIFTQIIHINHASDAFHGGRAKHFFLTNKIRCIQRKQCDHTLKKQLMRKNMLNMFCVCVGSNHFYFRICHIFSYYLNNRFLLREGCLGNKIIFYLKLPRMEVVLPPLSHPPENRSNKNYKLLPKEIWRFFKNSKKTS